MTTRSIILHPHEARAYQEGRLSLLVRPVMFPISQNEYYPESWHLHWKSKENVIAKDGKIIHKGSDFFGTTNYQGVLERCPYQPGDELIGKETWAIDGPKDLVIKELQGGHCGYSYGPYYRADGAHEGSGLTWRSPATMPKEASRIKLAVESVAVKLLTAITNKEAIESGAKKYDVPLHPLHAKSRNLIPQWSIGLEPTTTAQCLETPNLAFGSFWNKTYAKKGYDFDTFYAWFVRVKWVQN